MNIIKWIWEAITSQQASYLGNFLGGFVLFFAAATYLWNKKAGKTDDYMNKIKRTFEHVSKLKNFYVNFYFLYINEFINNIVNKKNESELVVTSRNDNKTIYTGAAAIEQIRTDMLEIYKFLEETMYILKENKKYELFEVDIVKDYFKRYSFQIKEFFSGMEMMILINKSKTNVHIDGFGSIDEKDLQNLKNFFAVKFDFLK